MNLGNKIKERRKLLQLTQQELANRCELTKGYISQLESDSVSPSLETLEIILEVLGTNLSDFFKENDNKMIVFNKEEQYEKEFDSYRQTWLIPTAQEHMMEPIYVILHKNGETFHDYPHTGEEFGYVIEGEILVCYEDETFVCKKGESFYFVSNKNHYIKNLSDEESKVIWVSCPPNF
ncbi:MAG: XRE family transcriptional regulator [Acholeplasmatales bacterium]|nr:XRE family transcriptional regulator [Acholeplasmatales bacterium]